MKLIVATILLMTFASSAYAQDPLDPPPVFPPADQVTMPPEVAATIDKLTDNAHARARERRATIARRHRARARAAHWSYTWTVVTQNLISTNEDRACGWGASQNCYANSKRNVWRAWAGEHSVNHEAIWAQYTYCLPGCDYADSCSAIVRTVDHNDGGRVNIVQNYEWTHKESSCNLAGPMDVVP